MLACGRWPAMIILEPNGQLAAAALDVDTATCVGSGGVDTDDLPDRPLRRVGTGSFAEPNA
jgi:hypothetical protein